jgi:hydrogenase expression/formation protein HypD
MKFLDEYREEKSVRQLAELIRKTATRPWSIMEICGGQTHSILRYGIDQLLPDCIELLHGPGCPVCVTPIEILDKAHAIASRPEVIFCSFGDMLRVPGSKTDFLGLKSQGADIRIVYSPLDAVEIAAKNPDREVVFFAIGFETTAPANAMAAWLAQKRRLSNFSLLVSHVLVPPAIEALLEHPENRIQAFLGPGHVCTIVGFEEYEPIAKKFRIPIVITGFEPVDLLEGIWKAVVQLESGRTEVENQYSRAACRTGNALSQQLLQQVFEVCDRPWRGMGVIPRSGWRLNRAFESFDAEKKFSIVHEPACESSLCISGQILRGLKKPIHCPAFGRQCTPQSPLGATMVSSEGACAAYFQYGRQEALP